MNSSSQSSLETRLERLERALATISGEAAAIRAELTSSASRAASAPPPVSPSPGSPPRAARATPPAPTPRPRRPAAAGSAESLDFETLVGRYGVLAISVLAAIAALGTFLSWAVAHGIIRLTPGVRVSTGLVAAAGLGVWGFKLRKRERSFGSTVLGLALVIVQVCAYAAGPWFHLVPIVVAFAGAALVSWALAIFAHAERDEPLWCVAFGGAAVAPFATSTGEGNLYPFLIYGLLVLLPACFAISHREWPVGWLVFYAAAGVYSLVGAELSHRYHVWGFLAAFAFPFIVAAAGIVPFAPESRKRAAIRWLGILGLLTSLAAPPATGQDAWLITGALVGTAALWLLLIDRQGFLPQSSILADTHDARFALDWIDVAIIPLLLALAGAETLKHTTSPLPVYVVTSAMFVAFAWRRAVNSLRDAAAFAAFASAGAVVATLHLEEPLGRLIAFVVLALASLAAHRAKPSVSWLVMASLVLVGTAATSAGLLAGRDAYTFTPFMTEPSATAIVVLIALILVARFWPSMRDATAEAMGDMPDWMFADEARSVLRVATLAPWVWAFVWVLIELAMAFSPSTSTLLLVTYFAATGVACVEVGRAKQSAELRQTGLCLAIAAAATACYGATTYFEVGARIAAYLVTSAFLLGIAYRYRRPGGAESNTAAPAAS